MPYFSTSPHLSTLSLTFPSPKCVTLTAQITVYSRELMHSEEERSSDLGGLEAYPEHMMEEVLRL